MRAYAVTTPIVDREITYYALTASKARMRALRNAWDAGFEITFRDVKVRALGLMETPREIAQRKCDAFNARHRVGEMVRCYPVIPPSFDQTPKLLEIREPGAYVHSGGYPVVSVRGDQWALEAVLPIDKAPPPVMGCSL